MPITQVQAQAFCDTKLRPLCERLRAVFHLYDAVATGYTADYQAFFSPGGNPANSEFVDARTDAPHDLAASDVAAIMTIFGQLAAVGTQANQVQVEVGCVQPLTVS